MQKLNVEEVTKRYFLLSLVREFVIKTKERRNGNGKKMEVHKQSLLELRHMKEYLRITKKQRFSHTTKME